MSKVSSNNVSDNTFKLRVTILSQSYWLVNVTLYSPVSVYGSLNQTNSSPKQIVASTTAPSTCFDSTLNECEDSTSFPQTSTNTNVILCESEPQATLVFKLASVQ